MSVNSEIERLQGAKSALKTAIEGKGVSVPASTKLDGYSALVDSIETGGGEDCYEFMPFVTSTTNTTFEAPLGEKNLVISILCANGTSLEATVKNSLNSKSFSYTIYPYKTFWFVSPKSKNAVYVATTSTFIK